MLETLQRLCSRCGLCACQHVRAGPSLFIPGTYAALMGQLSPSTSTRSPRQHSLVVDLDEGRDECPAQAGQVWRSMCEGGLPAVPLPLSALIALTKYCIKSIPGLAWPHSTSLGCLATGWQGLGMQPMHAHGMATPCSASSLW